VKSKEAGIKTLVMLDDQGGKQGDWEIDVHVMMTTNFLNFRAIGASGAKS
jgi:hypothetical protein